MAKVLTHNQTFDSPEDAFKHHGVKGMKWGVTTKDRPSGSGGSSRQEKKQQRRDTKVNALTSQAAKADIRVNELKAEIAKLPKGSGIKNAMARNDLTYQLNQTVAYRDHLNKTAEQVKSGGLTTNQKRLLIGGAIAGGLLAAGYLSTKQDSGELNSLKLRGQAALHGKPFDFKRNESFAHAKTPDEALAVSKGVNPNYKLPGGQMNCRRCTFTYELRRRGYDVQATASPYGRGQSETGLLNALSPGERNVTRATSLSSQVAGGLGIRAKAYGDSRVSKGERFSHPDAKDREGFLNMLNKQPDGARGEAVFNFGGFGHSLAYERFGNKTYIFDTQKGQRYDVGDKTSYESFLTKWGYTSVKDVQVTRLDNAPLDQKFLARWATNAKPQSAAQKAQDQSEARAKAAAAESRARGKKFAKETLNSLNNTRPANMHITTWNSLQRKAGLNQ